MCIIGGKAGKYGEEYFDYICYLLCALLVGSYFVAPRLFYIIPYLP